MISEKLEIVINKAIRKANQLGHEYLTLEGVLSALLEDDLVVDTLAQCGANVDQIKSELDEFINNPENFSVLSLDQISDLSDKQFVNEDLKKMASESGIKYQPEVSLALQRVIQRAALHVQSSGKDQIKGINVLVAMFQEKESYALYLIKKQGVERLNILQIIAHSLDRPMNAPEEGEEEGDEEGREEGREIGKPSKRKKKSALLEFAVNLNNMAEKGKIDPLIGRENELRRIVQVLLRRRKNNPLLVGDAGVGKTAIAEGLAWAIVNKKVPELLETTTIFSLDMATVLAGAKFRGEFEQRLKAVLKELVSRNEKGRPTILFIDEIHTVMGAGATGSGNLDASNLLKPYLSSGQLKCLGSTTHEEYRKFIEKEPAFNRRFQKIDVKEPSRDETLKILQGLKPHFEKHHGVKYSNTILKAAVDLSEKHLPDNKLPDKAIDVIDEAGAAIRLLPSSKRRTNVSMKDIENTISYLARIPKKSVAANEKEQLKNLKKDLQMLIYGQDEAVSKVSDSILMSRSGLGSDERPIANFLFAGPTGVGKTELAKQLGTQMGIHFERFDMSEYMEKHTVAKLIGAPPGYVGHDRGGLLTDAIKQHPHAVLLLDEIEKAHPDIYNILLQVMDHGVLTDSHGRSTDFRNVILIMTTNAGAKEMDSGSIGLGGENDGTDSKRDHAIKNFFSPEFRNRLDSIVHFSPLSTKYVINIVDKFLGQLELKLTEKKVTLEIPHTVKEWLAKTGYDQKMGARPLERIITEKIKRPLSQEILFGRLENGGKVSLKVVDEEIIFEFSS